ncbi:cyclase family protein [Spirochaeta isovalerica]|uniref:Kynurenine formamidase n=1 Tax=Spirochaeta isovalerica TaxID=150 RepID=A0A841R8F6_9SPIO|nr:cyclase family protein [Spirochaeta isovalerica]MBB6481564.1 kynurenine formamidase [Spirochaeta isovalerica]
MKLIDLTHTLSEDMPVYPGTEKPVFLKGNTIEEDGFAEKKITMFSHTGTHMDAPAHLMAGRPSLDDFPIDKFSGRACLFDFSGQDSKTIDIADLTVIEPVLEHCDFLLIRTGWDRFWGTEQYFSDFPVLTEQAALWLSKVPLKGIGIDAISVDPVETTDFTVHRKLLNKNFVIIENLTNLDRLPEYGFSFSAYPLKIQSADGSPVRAVAAVEEKG